MEKKEKRKENLNMTFKQNKFLKKTFLTCKHKESDSPHQLYNNYNQPLAPTFPSTLCS
jgi:hypothetical protein